MKNLLILFLVANVYCMGAASNGSGIRPLGSTPKNTFSRIQRGRTLLARYPSFSTLRSGNPIAFRFNNKKYFILTDVDVVSVRDKRKLSPNSFRVLSQRSGFVFIQRSSGTTSKAGPRSMSGTGGTAVRTLSAVVDAQTGIMASLPGTIKTTLKYFSDTNINSVKLAFNLTIISRDNVNKTIYFKPAENLDSLKVVESMKNDTRVRSAELEVSDHLVNIQ